jgi:hypothetical protein
MAGEGGPSPDQSAAGGLLPMAWKPQALAAVAAIAAMQAAAWGAY